MENHPDRDLSPIGNESKVNLGILNFWVVSSQSPVTRHPLAELELPGRRRLASHVFPENPAAR
jgi:hypothetical protein